MYHQQHTTWECVYHVVIVPKYRKKVLYGNVRQRIGQIIRELAKQRETEIIQAHACPDHIHMILSIPPKHSVASVLGFLKGKSAIRAHLEFSRQKKPLTQKCFWSRGYFVRTVGIDREAAEKYVRDQWKKDQYIDGSQLDLHWNWTNTQTASAPFRGFSLIPPALPEDIYFENRLR